MSNTDCVFCKIIAAELPSTKIYEDDNVLAFMDIGPVAKGHVLVIPKEHSEMITDTGVEVLSDIMAVVKKVAQAQIDGMGADGVNITQANGAVAGQVVNHIHFHVIPRFNDDNVNFNWQAGSYRDSEEMAGVVERIKEKI